MIESDQFDGWATIFWRASDSGREHDPDRSQPSQADIRVSTELHACDVCETIWLFLPGNECLCGQECGRRDPPWG